MAETITAVPRDGDARIAFRKPVPTDGAPVWALIRACAPLDENSLYCNLLQCDHFRDTCILAEHDGRLAGWISGYLLPADPRTLFVWQVAVAPGARGLGLGRQMLERLLDRPECRDVTRLQTTITPDNDASWALFRSLARHRGARLEDRPHFTRAEHFEGRHATEHMVTLRFSGAATRAA